MNNDVEEYSKPVLTKREWTEEPALFVDHQAGTAELVADQGIFGGEAPTEEKVNDVLRKIAEGEDAKRELSILKPTLAYALSKLEKKQLRVRAEDMPTLGDRFTIQAKSDGQGGIILRSVKTTREVNGL